MSWDSRIVAQFRQFRWRWWLVLVLFGKRARGGCVLVPGVREFVRFYIVFRILSGDAIFPTGLKPAQGYIRDVNR